MSIVSTFKLGINRLPLDCVNVKDWGAVGDGATDDTIKIQAAVDACFGPASTPHGGNSYSLNKVLFFPCGKYNITSPILFPPMQGGHVFGAGKYATHIVNVAGSGSTQYYGSVFKTDAADYCRFEHMTLEAVGKGGGLNCYCFVGGWNRTTPDTTSTTHSGECMFRNVRFLNGDGGSIWGVAFGANTDVMGSEVLYDGCTFESCSIGMEGLEFNALDYTVIGGSCVGCAIGLSDNSSSPISSVIGMDFSGSTTCDCNISGGSGSGMALLGCTSSSTTFLSTHGGSPVKTKACIHNPLSGSGYYTTGENYVAIDASYGLNTVFQPPAVSNKQSGKICVRGCNLPGTFTSAVGDAILGATFTGSITLTALSTSAKTGTIYAGMLITGTGVAASTRVLTDNGDGTYVLSVSQNVPSRAMVATPLIENI